MSIDYASILGKICLASIPTIVFAIINVSIDCMLNESDLERRFDSIFPVVLIFFAAVYLWQNR
jgi:hypothetical protein